MTDGAKILLSFVGRLYRVADDGNMSGVVVVSVAVCLCFLARETGRRGGLCVRFSDMIETGSNGL